MEGSFYLIEGVDLIVKKAEISGDFSLPKFINSFSPLPMH